MMHIAFDREKEIKPLRYFSGRICHDLNNLITSSMGATTLLEMKIQKAGLEVDRELDRLKQSLNGYVSFTQKLSKIFLEEAAGRIKLPLSTIFMGVKEEADVFFEVEGDHSGLHILTAPDDLTLAFLELVRNAIESYEGAPILEVLLETHPEQVIIRLRDYGRGIPPEMGDRVFTPFFSSGKRGNLVGLGLPLAGEIIAQHGGTLHLETEKGQGTSAVISLPLA
jgi:signal transduction histidine kinase